MQGNSKSLWVIPLMIIGIPILLVGCVLASMFLSATWPLPLVSAAVIGTVFLAFLVRTLRRSTFSRRWKWPVAFGVLWVLCLICLPLSMLFATARSNPWISNEESHLKMIARALEIYRSEFDDKFPPAEGWDMALKPYFRQMGNRGPSQRPFSHEGWNPGGGTSYRYVPPKAGAKLEDAVIVGVTDWEDEMGVHLYLYGDGRVEKWSVWPWWKYLWTGKVFH